MITDTTQLQKILSLADTAKPLDKELKQLCDGDDEAEEETNDDVVPPPLPLEAPASSRPRQDAESVLRAAVQVLRATAPGSTDFSNHPACVVDGHRVTIHFDNFSHTSGKQRCYVKCASHGASAHRKCFHDGNVDGVAR